MHHDRTATARRWTIRTLVALLATLSLALAQRPLAELAPPNALFTLSMSEQQQARSWRRFLPISYWLTSYHTGNLPLDLIAALTVWALVVPEAMAYASLAGMPPETGLYAAPLALIAYAIFGSSPDVDERTVTVVALTKTADVLGQVATAVGKVTSAVETNTRTVQRLLDAARCSRGRWSG